MIKRGLVQHLCVQGCAGAPACPALGGGGHGLLACKLFSGNPADMLWSTGGPIRHNTFRYLYIDPQIPTSSMLLRLPISACKRFHLPKTASEAFGAICVHAVG